MTSTLAALPLPAEAHLHNLLDKLARLMETRRALEFARASAVARLDLEARSVVASETFEEFAASAREHAARLADVGKLDAELVRLDRLRARALRSTAGAATRAADDAADDLRANVESLRPV